MGLRGVGAVMMAALMVAMVPSFGTSAEPGPVAQTVQVAIVSPLDGYVSDGGFLVQGTADHADGIAVVELLVDGRDPRPVDGFTTNGTTATWSQWVSIVSIPEAPFPSGRHTLTARATAASGATATASITFYWNDGPNNLVVTSVSSKTGPTEAEIWATVQTGPDPVVGVPLRFEYLNHGTWYEITTMEVNILRGSIGRFVMWEADGKVGHFDIRVTIDPEDVIRETDDGDNLRTARAGFVHAAIPGVDPFEPV